MKNRQTQKTGSENCTNETKQEQNQNCK